MNSQNVVLVLLGLALILGLGLLILQPLSPPEPPKRVLIPEEEIRVAVAPFQDRVRNGELGADIQARIESALAGLPGIKVFSRSQLTAILEEQNLNLTGLVDPETALKLGGLTGVTKLVAGVVQQVSTGYEKISICTQWQLWPPACLETEPGTKITVTVVVQFQIFDAQNGLIEAGDTITEQASKNLIGSNLGGAESLLAEALDRVVRKIVAKVSARYTGELRYGFYTKVRRKQSSLIGENERRLFTTKDKQVVLLIHFIRVKTGSRFSVRWIGPQGEIIESPEQAVASDLWVPFALNLEGKAFGSWQVEGYLNGSKVFSDAFNYVSPNFDACR